MPRKKKKATKTKVFNGKRYKIAGNTNNKRAAKKWAKNLRERGKKARFVGPYKGDDNKNYYLIYSR